MDPDIPSRHLVILGPTVFPKQIDRCPAHSTRSTRLPFLSPLLPFCSFDLISLVPSSVSRTYVAGHFAILYSLAEAVGCSLLRVHLCVRVCVSLHLRLHELLPNSTTFSGCQALIEWTSFWLHIRLYCMYVKQRSILSQLGKHGVLC